MLALCSRPVRAFFSQVDRFTLARLPALPDTSAALGPAKRGFRYPRARDRTRSQMRLRRKRKAPNHSCPSKTNTSRRPTGPADPPRRLTIPLENGDGGYGAGPQQHADSSLGLRGMKLHRFGIHLQIRDLTHLFSQCRVDIPGNIEYLFPAADALSPLRSGSESVSEPALTWNSRFGKSRLPIKTRSRN